MKPMIRTLAIYAAVLTATANIDLAFDSMLPVKADGTHVATKVMDFNKIPVASDPVLPHQGRPKKSLVSKR